ncbi:hypothetical protein [Microcoleus sp. Pol17_C1]|uniref:hypothetical protein n=1 Tax=unclassified Microcoleus TaxID=2642155 RepID=UPI002FD46AFC
MDGRSGFWVDRAIEFERNVRSGFCVDWGDRIFVDGRSNLREMCDRIFVDGGDRI